MPERVPIRFTKKLQPPQQTNKAMTNSHPIVNCESLCNVEKTDKKWFIMWHESTAASLTHSHLMHVCCGSKRTNIHCDRVHHCRVRAVHACVDPVLEIHTVSYKFWNYILKIETTGAIFSKLWEVVMWSLLTLYTKFQDNWFTHLSTATFCMGIACVFV